MVGALNITAGLAVSTKGGDLHGLNTTTSAAQDVQGELEQHLSLRVGGLLICQVALSELCFPLFKSNFST